jgi:hypothetical protein
MVWRSLKNIFHHGHGGHRGSVFLLDRETTIQQKTAALRAGNKFGLVTMYL